MFSVRLQVALLDFLIILFLAILTTGALAWTPDTKSALAGRCFKSMPGEWQRQIGPGLATIKKAASTARFDFNKGPKPANYPSRDAWVEAVLEQEYRELVASAVKSDDPAEGLEHLGRLAGLIAEAHMPLTGNWPFTGQAGASSKLRASYEADVMKALPTLTWQVSAVSPKAPYNLADRGVWARSFEDAVTYAYDSGTGFAVLRSITRLLLQKSSITTVEAWMAALRDVSAQLKQQYYLVESARKRGNIVYLKGEELFFPLRKIAAFGRFSVTWQASESRAYAVREDRWAAVKPNDRKALLDGKTRKLRVAPEIIEGALAVPAQFVEEFLGMKVTFDKTSPLIMTEDLPAEKRELWAAKTLPGEENRGWFWWWPF